jgi:addiction module HigA family antidote
MVEANIRPVHPGEMLREDLLEPLGLNVSKAAAILKVSRGALSAVLNEHAALSSEMAYRFEKAFGVKTDFLLRVQARYDALIAHERYADIDVQRYVAA